MNTKTAPSQIRHRRKAGFSLIEIVLVFALLGILAVVLVQNVDAIFGGGQEDGAKIWVTATVKVPLTMYKKDIGV